MTETLDSRLQPIVAELVRARIPFGLLVDDFEQKVIRAALLETGGNVTKAAQLLGVHRNSIHNRIAARSGLHQRAAERNARARWRR